jgi:hypothetical protein
MDSSQRVVALCAGITLFVLAAGVIAIGLLL